MQFEVGETVVYPHHGPSKIVAVRKRKIAGEEKIFLKLHASQPTPVDIEIPADSVELVGIRDVIDPEGLERVFDVLRAPFTEEPSNWSRRFKLNNEKLSSGDIIKISEVVRDLWRRSQGSRSLSAGEKGLFAKARQILLSELALAKKVNEDEASAILDEVLASEPAAAAG